MKNQEIIESTTICPYIWNQFCMYTDGNMRICCSSGINGHVKNDNGNYVKFDSFESLDEYYNQKFYKDIRLKMLNGEMPSECNECFKIEKMNGFSARMQALKSYTNNNTFLKTLSTTKADGSIKSNVQYVDLSLSNVCNLKCITCSPNHSSILVGDFDKIGVEGGLSYDKEVVNSAKKLANDETMFTKHLEEMSKSIEHILFSGGEPFLDKKHVILLKKIISEGRAGHVSLSYNTNCSVIDNELMNLWNEFNMVYLQLSVDAFGELNEYIRKNSNWKSFEENVKVLIDHPKTICVFQTTVQALNILKLTELYDWSAKIANKYSENPWKISPMPKHIMMWEPRWLHVDILSIEIKMEALRRLNKYLDFNNSLSRESREQVEGVIIFLKDSMSRDHDLEQLARFQKLIPSFEAIRNQKSILTLIPEFKSIL